MQAEDDLDLSEQLALVLDDNAYARAISVDQLRALGVGRAVGVGSAAAAWDALLKIGPTLMLMDWLGGMGAGLDFVRRIRTSDELPSRAIPIFMLTARGARADVESARLAGVDGYLRKPISALALKTRVRRVLKSPQPFIAMGGYVGPCRRRKKPKDYAGPWRRLDDAAPVSDVAGDEDVLALKAQIARAQVAALETAVGRLMDGDSDAARGVYRAVQALVDAAEQIGDASLALGAREMARYVQAQGMTERLDADVVNTHLAALHQLAHLPHTLAAERDKVAKSLKRMIDKKLRQANAA
jgi:CheY-like chemotaxis protein